MVHPVVREFVRYGVVFFRAFVAFIISYYITLLILRFFITVNCVLFPGVLENAYLRTVIPTRSERKWVVTPERERFLRTQFHRLCSGADTSFTEAELEVFCGGIAQLLKEYWKKEQELHCKETSEPELRWSKRLEWELRWKERLEPELGREETSEPEETCNEPQETQADSYTVKTIILNREAASKE